MNDDSLQSRGRLRRRRRFVRITVVLGVLILLVLAILVGLSWLPQMRIVAADVEGASIVSTSTIESTMQKTISGTYWHLFPKNNLLLYSREAIIDDLLQAYPPLKAVSIQLKDPHTLWVKVLERTPTALWCGLRPLESVPCIFLDSTGAAYAPGAEYSGDVYIHYYGALSTSTVPQRYLDMEKFEELHALIEALQQSVPSDPPKMVAVDEHQDVFVTFSSGFMLMFSLQQDEGIVRNRFTLAIKSGPFADKKLSDFEYLDLRFGDKLYYKPK